MSAILASQSRKNTLPSSITIDKAESNRKHIVKCYQADHQVKYLHLEAEIEVLIHQLQALKKTKQ